MKVAKEVFEAEGLRVRGAALAGKAAAELQEGSGIESRTLASLERAWANGRDLLTRSDVLVIDEAGMIDSRQMDRVLHAARKAGARVVLLGDDKQLSAIDAGAALRAIVERTGAAEITDIRRQKHEWMRAASKELARGDMGTAIRAYAGRGCIQMLDTREDAAQATAAAYVRDMDLGEGQIILSQTNVEVQRLNALVRSQRQARGELQDEASFRTSSGVRTFAAGDRILFRQNDSSIGVMNGTLGTVLDAEKGRLVVRLDGEAARTIEVDAQTYQDISHGYAVTVHKSQGISVDRSYVLATRGVDRALAYVMATRHKQAMQMFGAAEDFMDCRAGRLLAHGRAPFENRPGARESYFVTLENPRTGKQSTTWGIDLERAMAEASPATGESIRLDHCGAQSVRLPNGGTAERHTWAVQSGPDLALDGLIKRFSHTRKKENALDFAQRHGIEKPAPELIMEQQATPHAAAQERRARLLPDILAGRHSQALDAVYGEDAELLESLSMVGQVDPRDLAGMPTGAAEDALMRLNRAEQIRELTDAIELDSEYGEADDMDRQALRQLRMEHAADRAGLDALRQIEQNRARRQAVREIEGASAIPVRHMPDNVEAWKAQRYREELARGLDQIAGLAQATGSFRDPKAFVRALETEARTREGARTFGQKVRAIALGEAEGKDAMALAGKKNWLGREDAGRVAAREGLIGLANELSDLHSRTERQVIGELADLRALDARSDAERRAPEIAAAIEQDRARQIERDQGLHR